MQASKILIISPEKWGPVYVSKHHYANYLSENNDVYFLNPPEGYHRNPFRKTKISTQKISSNLTVVSYKNKIPRINSKFWNVKLRNFTYALQSKDIQDYLKVEKFDIIWSFDPSRFFNQGVWKSANSIYHSVDFHTNSKFEADIIQSSNHCFAVSELIIQSMPFSEKIVKIGHGTDLKGLAHTVETKIPGKNEIKATYVGNFHKDIDYELLYKLVYQNSDVDFIMIGPTGPSNLSTSSPVDNVSSDLKALENVYFLGEVDPKLLGSYLLKSDINLVLFKESRAKAHCNPHKMMGYFFSGRITLSSNIFEYRDASEEMIVMVESNKEIPDKFTELKNNLAKVNSPELINKRRTFALNNSYENKIIQIYSLLNNVR